MRGENQEGRISFQAVNIKVDTQSALQNERLVSLSGAKSAVVKAHMLVVVKLASPETRPETRGNVAELENALNELNTRLEADDEFREHGPKIVQNIADALAGVERTRG